MDYYLILGLDRNAASQEIKTAYRRLALQYHPDKNSSPEAKHKFQELTQAYSVLIDDKKRYNYDHGISEDEEIDFDDLMNLFGTEFFSDLGFPVFYM